MSDKPNPARYRELSEPMADYEVAAEAVAQFFTEFYELRVKHRIPDALVTVMVNYIAEDGEETQTLAIYHAGKEANAEAMAAYCYGRQAKASADRAARMLSIGRGKAT